MSRVESHFRLWQILSHHHRLLDSYEILILPTPFNSCTWEDRWRWWWRIWRWNKSLNNVSSQRCSKKTVNINKKEGFRDLFGDSKGKEWEVVSLVSGFIVLSIYYIKSLFCDEKLICASLHVIAFYYHLLRQGSSPTVSIFTSGNIINCS